MNIFHKLAKQETIDYVNNKPDLFRLVAELSNQFKVKALDYHIVGQKVLLVEDSGVPFGVASINGNSKGELNYQFNAPFIEKERGRGSDRSARKSIKLPTLIKLLKKDHKEKYEPSINRLLYSRLPEVIQDSIFSVVGQDRYSRDIGQDATKALIGFFTEQKMITDSAILKTIDEYVVKMKEGEEKKLQRESKLDAFKTDLHLIMECDNPTFLAGTLKYDATANKYLVHEDVNCYTSIEDLEQTQPQLMLSYKMYRVGMENKIDFDEDIVPRKDNYFPDFEVITYYFLSDGVPSVQASSSGNTTIRLFLTPKLG
jgi:hypothetical protein